jgi:hypothetical protein
MDSVWTLTSRHRLKLNVSFMSHERKFKIKNDKKFFKGWVEEWNEGF